MNPFSTNDQQQLGEYGEVATNDDDEVEAGPLIVPVASASGGGYRDAGDGDGDGDEDGQDEDSVSGTQSRGGGRGAGAGRTTTPACQRRLRIAAAIAMVLVAGGLGVRVLLVPTRTGSAHGGSGGASAGGGKRPPPSSEGEGRFAQDPDRPVPRAGDRGEPAVPRSYRALADEFRRAKAAYVERLHAEYGPEYYDAMFVQQNVTVGRLALRSPSFGSAGVLPPPFSDPNATAPAAAERIGPSWDRLKRRIAMKLLQAQVAAAAPMRGSSGGSRMPKFVWATGGHSAAAAHGDLYNESYTAVLERAVRPALQALGVWFEARNYAMGGTASAPELALCSVPVYGTDADAVSWDFGMIETRDTSSMEMFFRQASLGPGRPACVALEIQGNVEPRRAVMRKLEESGVAALFMPPDVASAVQGGIPDSFGRTEAELRAMPRFVRSFKCEGILEKGSPGCADAKYTPVCPGAKYRVSWHPGWKWHALVGNLLGLSLLEAVGDALSELEGVDLKKRGGAESALQELKALEDAEYEGFYRSDPTSYHDEIVKEGAENLGEDFNVTSMLFTRRPYCHTARLPAESRYLGILTESASAGFFHYDAGISHRRAKSEANNGTSLRLVYEEGERQGCELLLNVDYKDFFYLGEPEGAKSLVLPNDAELRAYGAGQSLAGVVGFVFATCDWGKCPEGNLQEPGLDAGEWEMSVNGIPVTGRVKISPTSAGVAVFVRHKDGWRFPPNADGRFEIRVKVNSVGKYLRFSSFLIY